MTALELFGLLVAAHALADYPLQGDFLARAKNETAPLTGVPWYQAMGAHCVIHGAAVGLLTGSALLALMEAAAHFVIDRAKCRGAIRFDTDQALHIACKVAWTMVAIRWGLV